MLSACLLLRTSSIPFQFAIFAIVLGDSVHTDDRTIGLQSERPTLAIHYRLIAKAPMLQWLPLS